MASCPLRSTAKIIVDIRYVFIFLTIEVVKQQYDYKDSDATIVLIIIIVGSSNNKNNIEKIMILHQVVYRM